MQRRLSLSALALMASGSFAAYKMEPRVHVSDLLPKMDLETLFPNSFGDWQIDPSTPVILPSPDVQAALNAVYNQVLSRTYVNRSGQRIMLSVAYGGDQSDGTKIHRPENCYPGQGFTILANQVDSIKVTARDLPVRRLIARMNSRVEPISYWMIVGEKVALSSLQNKLAQLEFGVKGEIADGMLVRVSSINTRPELDYPVHDVFVRQMFDAIKLPDRRRVFGV
ncbi:exosortase-associated protein EpsI, B-type [Paucibacter sp. AS339]|uniref:exosortase-associated protein EpsI, B-type n=1 Tax=Paucibacter hankyongi TaxID=3133434 RepID=UPI0030A6F1DD